MLTSNLATALGRATFLFLAALVSLSFTKRSSPAARHLICSCAFAGSLAILLTVFIQEPAVTIHIPVFDQSPIWSGGEPIGWTWSKSAAVIWICGCAMVVFRFLIGYAEIARAHSSARPFVPSGRRSGHEEIASEVPLFAADVSVPLVTGLFRPVILMPRAAADWPEPQRSAALRHELAHLERNDLWVNFAAAVVCAIYWFHPLAWVLVRRMHTEQEAACDDIVLQSGFDCAVYAEALVETARCASAHVLLRCSMTDRLGVKARVIRVLSSAKTQPGPPMTRQMSSCVFAGVIFVLVGVSSIGVERVYKVGSAVTVPVVIHRIDPAYTRAARNERIQGKVLLNLVVDPDGIGRDIVVTRGIDSGLDQNAVRAIRQWRFKPATRDARPVAVKATIQVNFLLR